MGVRGVKYYENGENYVMGRCAPCPLHLMFWRLHQEGRDRHVGVTTRYHGEYEMRNEYNSENLQEDKQLGDLDADRRIPDLKWIS
jgi:hypothetical protein